MTRITRSEVLRKCIIVFDALRRVASKGNAGLEPALGAEDEFEMDTAITAELRQMLREMEAGESRKMAEWQRDIMENGVPERLDLK